MKTSVNTYEFQDALKGHFSYEGLSALFEYFEELEEDMGYEIDFDPIAIRCEYTEYESLKAVQEDYPDIESFEHLMDYCNVVAVPNPHWVDFLKEFPQFYGEDFCSAGLIVTQF
jgi:hypothetical protein